MGDLERSIARLCASSLGGFGRDNASVVLYEDQAKKKVAAFRAVLRGLEKLQVWARTVGLPQTTDVHKLLGKLCLAAQITESRNKLACTCV